MLLYSAVIITVYRCFSPISLQHKFSLLSNLHTFVQAIYP